MTDEFDSSISDSSSESFDSEPEPMPEIPSDPEPELESAPEITPEPEVEPEPLSEPEIEPTKEIDPEYDSDTGFTGESDTAATAEIEPELLNESADAEIPMDEKLPTIDENPIDEELPADDNPVDAPLAIGDGNPLDDEVPVDDEISIDETPVDAPLAIGDGNPLDDEIPVEDEASIDETPVDDPLAIGDGNLLDDEVPVDDEISIDETPVDVPIAVGNENPLNEEIPTGDDIPTDNESQIATEATPEGESEEIPEYLAEPDTISEGDIFQQADSSAATPEMLSEQDGLVEEGSPEKQTTAGSEPEANGSNIAQTTGAYSPTGASGNTVDAEDDGVMSQSQVDEPPQRQPFKTDYSEDDLGKAATEINNENMDISAQVDDVMSAQEGSNSEMPPIPADTNVIKDAQERDITIRRWGDDELIQLRAYDSAAGSVPETPNLGTAGMTNLKIEAEPDGQTKVRLQDIVIPPDYRNSGIAGNMLDETVDIAQAKGASEIYGVIENEEALGYWQHMEEKGTGWKVDPSEGAHGYVRYNLSDAAKKKALN